jgi:hypothetical protein
MPEPPLSKEPRPGVKEEPIPDLPVDIPEFAIAKSRVASGQKPWSGGLTWLRDKGYRTVLRLRLPEEDDSADRKLFEARGFKYLSLSLSPTTLNREVVEQFNQIVADPNNLPLFVYDRDSALTGALWYLHFRLVEQLPDDRANAEARRLGFRPSQYAQHQDMALAAQKYLDSAK